VGDVEHRVGERVAQAARHVAEALEQDVESLATPTPAEAIAKTAAVARGADEEDLAKQDPPALPVDIPVEPLTEADLTPDEPSV
jgi:hypothetical protein